jgi:glucosamine-6-phosphate deaminase
MNYIYCENAEELGEKVAQASKLIIDKAIKEKGEARVIFSTGASQFTTFEALLKQDIDWSRVVAFHLDEYIGIDESHPASFIKYLKERFVNRVNLKMFYFVDPKDGVINCINKITK